MVAWKMNQQQGKPLPIDNRHRNLLVHGRDSDHDTITTTDDGLASWRLLRVLIVDDAQDLKVDLFTWVGAWGHAAKMACGGRAALIAAAGEPPDVVLLNLELRSTDGHHLARQLRLHAPRTDCFIIAVADWADHERRRQCSEAGIDLLLVNPLDRSVLEVLLWLECVHTNRLQAAKAGNQQNFQEALE